MSKSKTFFKCSLFAGVTAAIGLSSVTALGLSNKDKFALKQAKSEGCSALVKTFKGQTVSWRAYKASAFFSCDAYGTDNSYIGSIEIGCDRGKCTFDIYGDTAEGYIDVKNVANNWKKAVTVFNTKYK